MEMNSSEYGFFSLMFFPSMLETFLEGFLSRINAGKVYIPCANGIDVEICKKHNAVVHYQNINPNECEAIKQKTGIEALSGDVNLDDYDLVFSDLPFEPITPKSTILSLAKSLLVGLGAKSLAVFTFPISITSTIAGIKWLKELENDQVYVNAVIDMPSGVYAPHTNIESRIIVFSKEYREEKFIASIKDISEIDRVLDILFGPKVTNGRLGTWINRDDHPDYFSYDNAERRKRISATMAKNYKGKLSSLRDVCIRIDTSDSKKYSEDVDASVFIPKSGKSHVYTSIRELSENNQYFRLIVDQNLIIPKYLAFVLNSEYGIELRLRAMSNNTIPHINKSSLENILIPVPSKDFQSETIMLQSDLDLIINQANQLKEQLKQNPASNKQIRKEMKDINNNVDIVEKWISSLPYPLATILNQYYVADTEERKHKMLLFFFEAYSIFETAILVGAYKSYGDSPDEVRETVDPSFYEKATFGSWVWMDRALSKKFRKDLNDKDKMDKVFECFGTDDRNTILALCNGDVCNILEEISVRRNNWQGHSGMIGDEVYEKLVREMIIDLNKLMTKIIDIYSNVQLVRPCQIEYQDGKFTNRVEILSTSNQIFKKVSFVSSLPMDKNKLYVRMLDTNNFFELPPLLLMKNEPANVKNACYFYSRTEGDQSRYVSYHYEGQPEDYEQGSAAYTLIKGILE